MLIEGTNYDNVELLGSTDLKEIPFSRTIVEEFAMTSRRKMSKLEILTMKKLIMKIQKFV